MIDIIVVIDNINVIITRRFRNPIDSCLLTPSVSFSRIPCDADCDLDSNQDVQNCCKLIPLTQNIKKIEKLAGLRPANFLAPAVSWWPSASWRALWALWIAVWRAVLSETTAVRTELPDLRAAPSQCSISWQRPQLLQLN